MSDTIKIKLYIDTGFAGCKHEDVAEVDRAEWEAMSDEDREKHLQEEARDFLANHIDYGAYVDE